jgi:hypothetical protein
VIESLSERSGPMGFTKEYFDTFDQDLVEYCKTFMIDAPAVTFKLVYGGEYKVATIVSRRDKLISFAYHDARRKKSTTLQMMTVPYSGIAWIDVRPSKGKEEVGFQFGSQVYSPK